MESPRPRCEAMEVRAAMAPQDNLEGMSFPRLKALAAARGVDVSDLREKAELVAAAVRTVVNLCGDARRAAEVAAMGKILGRIRNIAEIMQNNVDVHRHRRVAYVEQRRPDKAAEEVKQAMLKQLVEFSKAAVAYGRSLG